MAIGKKASVSNKITFLLYLSPNLPKRSERRGGAVNAPTPKKIPTSVNDRCR